MVAEALSTAVDVTKSLNEITSSKLVFAKEVLQVATNVGETITPFIPLIGVAATAIEEIINIYQTSQYNKKICNSLLDRARIAEISIDQLIRRRKENEKNFKSQTWYKAFDRFVNVLNKLKDFGKKVSKLKGIKSFLNAKDIKERFEILITEYDTAMKDLNFTMAIDNEHQRRIDQKSVKDDLYEITQFLEKFDGDLEGIKNVLIIEQVENLSKSKHLEVKKIDKSQLTEPAVGKELDTRGSKQAPLKRKIYMNAIEVACKPVKISKENKNVYEELQKQMVIHVKVTQSPNIIQFYGLSEIGGDTVIVLEWAELGNLKELYEKEAKKIPLKLKLTYALHICRGIAYLNALEIYHHDLRCQNVVVTANNVAKLTNFEFSRGTGDVSKSLNYIYNVRWCAPEKLKDEKYRYNHKCEIYSFGMLLWELAFERLPYKEIEIDAVSDLVIKGNREEIQFDLASPDDTKIQKGFENIIREAWNQDPDIRISISKLLIDLDILSKSSVKPGHSPGLWPQEEVTNIPTKLENKEEEIPEYNDCIDFDSIDDNELIPMIPISEGIKAHREKDYKKAWKCFEAQAENQNSTGKYWKGYYLWEGFHGQKDKETALALYKEAADDNHTDAQYRYACALLDKDIKSKLKINSQDAVKYLRLAAKNGCGPAQFQIGEACSKGKLNYPKDQETAILWYKRAALQNEDKAIKKLKELKVDNN